MSVLPALLFRPVCSFVAIVVHRYLRIADGETWTLSEFIAEVGDFYAAGASHMSTRAVQQLRFLEGLVRQCS